MKKINIRREEQFIYNMYQGDGIYHNTNTDEILVVSSKAMFVVYIGPYNLWNQIFENTLSSEEVNTGTVSESFALKAIAILTNSDKLREYDI